MGLKTYLSVISLNSKVAVFGTRTIVGLPFTAPSDGVIHVYMVTSQVSGGYATLYLKCGSSLNFGFSASNIAALGGANTGFFFIKKGEKVTQEYISNISSYNCYFLPFK